MQNLRLLTACVKFHQICTLIGWYKFSAIKVQRSYVSWPWRVMQNLEKNLHVVSKMTRIWWILTQALKNLANLHFDWFLLCTVFNVWPKKYRGVIFYDTCDLENDKRNFANFHQCTGKCQNWDFNLRLSSKVEIVWV